MKEETGIDAIASLPTDKSNELCQTSVKKRLGKGIPVCNKNGWRKFIQSPKVFANLGIQKTTEFRMKNFKRKI